MCMCGRVSSCVHVHGRGRGKGKGRCMYLWTCACMTFGACVSASKGASAHGGRTRGHVPEIIDVQHVRKQQRCEL
eukprot:1531099-Alexandrium_andersonii.AAC.1